MAEARNRDAVDLLIIGGGVNGAGIARDAAGRGLSVLLCEKADLGHGTSSRSGKLVHGGLRYLEYYEFRLVREALLEREVLLRAAPHIIWPMRFVLPHNNRLRSAWLVRLGLFFYDHLGSRKRLPKSRGLDLRTAPEGHPLKKIFSRGFEYSDCWVEDARLVVLNARDAADRGAEILPRTECVSAQRDGRRWNVELRDIRSGQLRRVQAHGVVNAAGPWVDRVLNETIGYNSKNRVRLVRGSHIVIPKIYEGTQAYLFQHSDRRVIFVNPYEKDYLLIGTTDIPHEGSPDNVRAEDSEIQYLCDVVSSYFERSITPRDVIHSFSGVRPLYDDSAQNPSAVTRDYVFDVEGDETCAPLLSIFGGKITTYRKLSEHAMERLRPFYPEMRPAWTAEMPLPGGDMPGADFDAFLADIKQRYPWLPEQTAYHYVRCYGTRVSRILEEARNLEDLGRCFGACLHEAEVRYLMDQEWAIDAEDILWRRTKLGLHMTPMEIETFTQWFAAQQQGLARESAS